MGSFGSEELVKWVSCRNRTCAPSRLNSNHSLLRLLGEHKPHTLYVTTLTVAMLHPGRVVQTTILILLDLVRVITIPHSEKKRKKKNRGGEKKGGKKKEKLP